MEAHVISRNNLLNLLSDLQAEYTVLLPVKKGESRFYQLLSSIKHSGAGGGQTRAEATIAAAVVGEVRASEPLKAFYFRPRQKVARNYRDELPEADQKPLCLVGVKACDLKGFTVLDTVFLGDEYRDPFYRQARQENLVISADCTSTLDVCFCLAVQGNPYPANNFDLNLSELGDGYLLEAGSDRGRALLSRSSGYLRQATSEQIGQRDRQRAAVADRVKENIRREGVPQASELGGAVRKSFEAPLWREEAAACVECGACNTICPTCHCFQLFDQMDKQDLVRYRVWDSCLIKDFAKVAGGANPRPQLWMRLRNRFEKKFDYFPAVNDLYACTGCGRCILACPGKIDIRKVLKRNVENVQKR